MSCSGVCGGALVRVDPRRAAGWRAMGPFGAIEPYGATSQGGFAGVATQIVTLSDEKRHKS